MKIRVSVNEISAIGHESRQEILDLALECSNGDQSIGLWPRIDSLFHLSPSDSLGSFAVLATDTNSRLRGVALVAAAGKSLPSCQLFVAPPSRRRGIGRQLMYQALHESGSDGLRIWSHGDCQDGRSFAKSERLRLLQSVALFVLETDGSVQIGNHSVIGKLSFDIVPMNSYQAAWEDVLFRAYRTTRIAEELKSRSWWQQSWGVIVPDPNGREPAGVLVARSVHYKRRPSIENHVMAVAPTWQGKGISKVLLAGLITLAQDLKVSSIISYVESKTHAAVNAHRAMGFLKLSEDLIYVLDRSGHMLKK